MIKLFLVTFLIAITASAELDQLIEVREFCKCHFIINDNMTLNVGPKFSSCIKKINDIPGQKKSKEFFKSALFQELNNGSVICSEKDIDDWYKRYAQKNQAHYDKLKKQIEENLCSNPTIEVPQFRKDKCRESLFELTQNYQASVYDKCTPNFLNNEDDKNTCVKANIYQYLLSITKTNYFGQFCNVTEEEAKDQCDSQIKAKLKKTFYKEEISYCVPPEHFIDLQEKGISTCENFFIDKTIGFATEEEMNALVNCIKSNESQSAIEECLKNHYGGTSERGLLLELEDKYCNKDLYPTERLRKKCMSELLTNNFSNIETYPECAELANLQTDPSEKDRVFNSCQRKKHFEKLLASKQFEVSDCWDREKYGGEDFLAKQKECLDNASAFNDYLSSCERFAEPSQAKECLDRTDPKLKSNLMLHLQTKAQKLELDTSTCGSGNNLEVGCMTELVYNNPLGVRPGDLDENNCFSANVSALCQEGMDETDRILSEASDNTPVVTSPEASGRNPPLEDAIDLNNSLGSNNTMSTDQVVVDGDDLQRVNDDIKNLAGDNQAILEQDSGEIGFESIATDMSVMQNNSQYPPCRMFKKAAITRVFSSVAGIFMIGVSKSNALFNLNNTENKQEVAMDSVANLQGTANNVSQLNNAAGVYAENQVQTGLQIENQNIARGQPPQSCSSNGTTTFVDWDEQDKMKLIVLNNIDNSQNTYEVKNNLLEGIDILLGNDHSSNLAYEDLEFLDNFKEDELKLFSNVFIQYLSEVFLEKAYAKEAAAESPSNITSEFSNSLNEDDQKQLTGAVSEMGKMNNLPIVDSGNYYLGQIKKDTQTYQMKFLEGLQRAKAIEEISKKK